MWAGAEGGLAHTAPDASQAPHPTYKREPRFGRPRPWGWEAGDRAPAAAPPPAAWRTYPGELHTWSHLLHVTWVGGPVPMGW